ncbi:hypothetical protein CFC21_077438 [Triticum aestivum]|uniref:TF-B3 domain-containing protein n=3 Tax=Triticum aestivum TaxID=4565 RepID=A0A9R1HVP4_WHEAT|nr:hypothetical protein CFC21_077438 [Triticum aestivum]
MEKGKEVLPPMEVAPTTPEEVATDEDVVSKEPPSGKCHNCSHYQEEGGPTQFCKVILAPQFECIPMPLDFTKHFPAVPQEFKPRTNIGCSWGVTVRLMDDRVTLNRGWAPFTAVHQIRIDYMVMFKLLTPDTLKVIVFDDEGIEVVTKCGKHDDAFALNI